MRKFLNVAVHNHEVSFWETDLCRRVSYESDIDLLPEYRDESDNFKGTEIDVPTETEGRESAWRVDILYKNGTEQKTEGYDVIPDPVMELYCDFESYFEAKFSDTDVEDEGIDIDTE